MYVTSIVNGVDLDRLSATIDAVTADPPLARFQFRARNRSRCQRNSVAGVTRKTAQRSRGSSFARVASHLRSQHDQLMPSQSSSAGSHATTERPLKRTGHARLPSPLAGHGVKIRRRRS